MAHTPSAQASGRDAAVSLKGLSKTFGENTVLSAVNLEFRRGEVHGLIGENGSGKSTLIKCLSGVYTPDTGSQIVWGVGPAARRCAVVHQDLGLVPGLTVEENMAFGLGFSRDRFGRIHWRQHRARVREILERYQVQLDPRANIDTLSMAQRTLLAMARALTSADSAGDGSADDGVQMVILDEPTASLPLRERDQVVEVAGNLAKQGLAVLYVSHHLDEVAALSDRVTVLRGGSVVTTIENDGITPDELVTLMSGSGHTGQSVTQRVVETEVALSMRGIRTTLLRGVDLDLHRGEVVGLVGAPDSGAGDLCQLAAGALTATVGEVRIGIKSSTLLTGGSLQAARLGVLLVPADRKRRGIIGDLTVRENLALTSLRRSPSFRLLTKRSEAEKTQKLLESLDIRPRDPERLVGQLSGGNQQKVVIGRCLAAEPAVLVLENPTQGVDPAARLHIRKLIREAAERGIAVLVSDVDEAEVAAVADRIIEVDDGLIVPTRTNSATGESLIQGGTSA